MFIEEIRRICENFALYAILLNNGFRHQTVLLIIGIGKRLIILSVLIIPCLMTKRNR